MPDAPARLALTTRPAPGPEVARGRIIRSIDRGTRTVDGVEVQITEQVWDDEGRSFEVHRSDTGDALTVDGCFDTWPTDEQIADLLHTAGNLWSCPGCGATIDAGQADLVTDHLRDCDRVDGRSATPRRWAAMSGRVSPHEVIAALYQAVDDHRLEWLDELCIAAGFLRRCPCGAACRARTPAAPVVTRVLPAYVCC